MKAQLFASASAAALFASPVSVMAQEAESPAADTAAPNQQRDDRDILVTANRRTARLQDVPLSVTTFGQEEHNELGIVGRTVERRVGKESVSTCGCRRRTYH